MCWKKYSAIGHRITLYERDIEIQCERSLGSLARLEEYTWVILTHEMGHALDPDLAVLSEELHRTGKSEILYQIEVNAWNIAEGIIPFIDHDLFTFIGMNPWNIVQIACLSDKRLSIWRAFYFPLNGVWKFR
ncbi:hypothetical protein KEH51_21595 [[Brevibacterium] frigoritolerans]|uniref:Uncharacterized protein n=1 Tax=Peribacillus frigoritolerans TaxID=450367 RepID=A0A941FK48_9BACI|nr:hypothetical protein [Peribacillus frigoritolerans]